MFDGRKSQKGELFLQLSIRQMRELAVKYMQWQRLTDLGHLALVAS